MEIYWRHEGVSRNAGKCHHANFTADACKERAAIPGRALALCKCPELPSCENFFKPRYVNSGWPGAGLKWRGHFSQHRRGLFERHILSQPEWEAPAEPTCGRNPPQITL